jgi:hypothetical protein
VRIVGRAPVAEPYIKVAIRTELEHAAVVVRVRLPDLHQHHLARAIHDAPVLVHGEPRQHIAARPRCRVHHEQVAVLREVRVEGEPEQALLVERAQDLGSDVERDRRLGHLRVVLEQLDDAVALDDAEAIRAVARIRHVERILEAQVREGDDRLEIRGELVWPSLDPDRPRHARGGLLEEKRGEECGGEHESLAVLRISRES